MIFFVKQQNGLRASLQQKSYATILWRQNIDICWCKSQQNTTYTN